MRAAVIGADVARQRASTARPVALLLCRDRALRDVGKAVGVDATRRAALRPDEFRLRADGQPHALRRRDGGEAVQQSTLFRRFWITPAKAMAPRRSSEIALRLSVRGGEGDDDLVGLPRERGGQSLEITLVPSWRGQRRHDDRVVAPDDGALAPARGQIGNLDDRAHRIDDRALERARVAGQRILHDEGRAPAHRRQMRRERRHIPGPKNEPVDRALAQRHLIGGAAIGIADAAASLGQAAQEPSRIKGRNISSITSGNNHCVMASSGRAARGSGGGQASLCRHRQSRRCAHESRNLARCMAPGIDLYTQHSNRDLCPSYS
jgi:hypothetical protein